jgi:23S rRNA pseudouridine1911/1915/1917 synthase
MTDVVITNWFHKPLNIKSKRLQEAAISQFCELPSRKAVKKAIKKGRIFINGERGETQNWVKIGDRLSLEKSVVFNSEIYSNNLHKTSVIWEDEYGACVIKNAGLETNGTSKVTLEKICSIILEHSTLPDSTITPRTVHRLDKATHGLVLIAKTLSMASELGSAFEKREVFKSYTALIEGSLLLSFCEINIPINGKFASSKIEIIGSTKWPVFGTATLVKIHPKTGRKHQIRKHLAMIGHPIIGDNLYCGALKYTGQGLFLACTRLQFTHPITHESMDLETDLPRKFKHIIHKLNLP